MSMLAEPRQKKRYNLVPRGKALYEDTNRFGTKMLEKMGWSKGKGLGAREDGLKDFVRIRYKNDAEGFGYEDRDNQWTEHEKHFNGLLSSLNSSDSKGIADDNEPITRGFGFQEMKKEKVKNIISGVSLEEKSKNSKARVHYKKFTRGKDLTQYSEKDLANIFGKKTLENNEAEYMLDFYKAKDQKLDFSKNDEIKDDANFGINTINTGKSVVDYFKQKMEKLQRARVNNNEISTVIASNESSESIVNNVCHEEMSKKKKKKKHKHSEDELNVENASEENLQTDIEEPVKKKKKCKLIEIVESEIIDENTEEKYKSKKKKKKADKEKVIIADIFENKLNKIDEATIESIESINEFVKKKSKKSKSKEAKELFLVNQPESLENDLNKRKKKSKKQETSESEDKNQKKAPTELLSDNQTETGSEKNSNTKKLKKKKNNVEILEDQEEVGGNNLEKSKEEDVSLQHSINSFVISEFAAEKFRHTDFLAFCGSNISDILGYGVEHPIKIKIKHNPLDDANIIRFWKNTTLLNNEILDKKYSYGNSLSKYKQKVRTAQNKNKKIPKINVKQFQKKSMFNLNI